MGGNINQKPNTKYKKVFYKYKELPPVSREELFFWILLDMTIEQFGSQDLIAGASVILGQPYIGTRAKFGGKSGGKRTQTGTSILSIVSRKYIRVKLWRNILPMFTGTSPMTYKITWTSHVGRFVGRTIPVIGWIVLATDLSIITAKTITRYNQIVIKEDRIE